MILNKMKKITKKQPGFTLVEMLVVAPIVMLVIGIFINSIISMTGDILSVRASNNMVYQIQDALDRIDADVKLSGGFLATNNIPITSPQGYNNDSTTFRNASSVNGNALMLNAYATGNNPYNPTKKIMYLSNQPNACSSANINQNAAMTHNIVYFVKNNTLWRRVIMPSNYETVGCYNGSVAVPWQQPSCAPSTAGAMCKTQDEKLVDNISSGGFSVNYYPTPISVTANTVAVDSGQSDSNRQAALQANSTTIITINASSTIAGRDVNQTGTIKSTTTNSNTSSSIKQVSSLGAISGTTTSGSVLTAGTVSPSVATVSYQWQSANTANGTYTNIGGATSSTYTLTNSDVGKYLKVLVSGTGDYIGSQLSSATTPVNKTLALTFDASTDLTSNFSQVITNGTQTVTGGLLQMRSNVADVQNSITSNWTMKKITDISLRASFNFTNSAASYNYANFNLYVTDSNNSLVTSFILVVGFNYTYATNPGWTYWNRGYTWWSIGTDPSVQATAISHQLAAAPAMNVQNTYQLVDNGGGYIQYKLNGVNVGSPFYLGNPDYSLGGPFSLSQLNCWWNQWSYVDIDSLTVTYN